jgi:hypothetical protein
MADFVLFEDSNIYASYRLPSFTSAHSTSSFHTSISDIGDLSFTDILGASNMPDELQLHGPSSKHFYSLGSESMGSLPIASSSPEYVSEPTYSYFGSSDIPRTLGPSYMDKPAPGVLIHPPSFPFSEPSGHAEYRSTPAASPATSAGCVFEGSGSETGSTRNSPYNPPVGVEDNFQDFAINSGFVGTTAPYSPYLQTALTFPPGIDPSLVSNSPTEPHPSASPFDSPNWNAAQSRSPAPLPSGPSSPNLQRFPSQSGRLSPSIHHNHTSSRHVPYPSRRPSTGSVHSKKSAGSPTITNLEKEDLYAPTREVGYIPSRSPSQRSTVSVSESVVNSMGSTTGHSSGKEGKETLCPECHKCFRDLRAHQLTHLHERPEKCPIATCEYSKKGFARKYDCQRHTLTHYKGTMVCDFCPGSGSALEKSFNRADVFKRHLMAVHNVEQTPPNGRQKKSLPKSGKTNYSDEYTSGKCSTCSETFPTAQRFYEHLDECVLSKVVEDEPAAVTNERNLSQINTDEIEASLSLNGVSRENDDEDEDDEDDYEEYGDIIEAEDDEDKDETYGGTSKKHKSSRTPSTRFKSKSLRRIGSGSSR